MAKIQFLIDLTMIDLFTRSFNKYFIFILFNLW